MKSNITIITCIFTLLFFIAPSSLGATIIYPLPDTKEALVPEVHIDKNGNIAIRGAKVGQIAGSTLYVKTYWGTSFVRWIVTTKSSTQVIKKFGGKATLAELSTDHVINVDGYVDSTGDSIIIRAERIQDWSQEKEPGEYSGRINKINVAEGMFTIFTDEGVNVDIKVGTSTAIMKGAQSPSLAQLQIGDKVTRTNGTYNFANKVLYADKITIYQDQSIFKPRNFQGVMKSVSSTDLPATMILEVDSKPYTVQIGIDAKIMNNKRKETTLQRFVPGDIVRVYGAIQKEDFSVIDEVVVVRNTSL